MPSRSIHFRAPPDVADVLDRAVKALGRDRSAILHALIRFELGPWLDLVEERPELLGKVSHGTGANVTHGAEG